jgi:hypothetical protein
MDGTKNALAPLEFILSVAGALMAAILLIGLPFVVFGSGSMFGIGDPTVCVDAPQGALGGIRGGSGINEAHVMGTKQGVSTVPSRINVCDSTPSSSQHAWSALATAPTFFYALGFLVLAWRLVRKARRHGLFSPDVALGVGRLGLYVLLGALAVATLETWGSYRALSTLIVGLGPNDAWAFFHLSWAILFAGFGLLTIGRVMAQTVPMRAELDATI